MLRPIHNVKRLVEAEILKARLASRRATEQAIGWFIVAGLALMGFGMLFLAVFLALSNVFGHTVAALIVGGVILVVALMVALFVGPLRKHAAEDAAQAESQDARAELSSDLSQVTALLEGFGIGSGGFGGSSMNRLLIMAAVGLGMGLLSKKARKKPKKN